MEFDRDRPDPTTYTGMPNQIEDRGDPSGLYPIIKRGLDISVASLMMVISAPIVLFAGLAVRLADGGPSLYWQQRVGHNGEKFWFPKLRSMHVGADQVQVEQLPLDERPGTLPKLEDDPRVTRLGRLLRRWSVDELPQLWCVLKGEMSMVGPRPSQPEEVACYGERERQRLTVKPGITCTWQVSGRSDVPYPDQIQLDLDYIERRGLLLDIQLLLRTVAAVLSRRGAY